MTGKLQFVCLTCHTMFTFSQALQHQTETGHSVELFQSSDNPNPLARLFVEKYWYPRKETW